MNFTNNSEQTGRSTGSESRYDEAQGFRAANPAEGMYGSEQATNFGQGRTGDLNPLRDQGMQHTTGTSHSQGGPGGEFGVTSIGGSGAGNFDNSGLNSQHHADLERAAHKAFDTNQSSGRTGASLDDIGERTGFKSGSGPAGGQFDDDFNGATGLGSNRSGIHSGNQLSSSEFTGERSREQVGNREFERGRDQDKSLGDEISNLKRDIENTGSNKDFKKGPRDGSF